MWPQELQKNDAMPVLVLERMKLEKLYILISAQRLCDMVKEEANVKGHHNASEKEIRELGTKVVEAKYGNLFQMYEKITADNPYETPMKIYPAVHYTMGGVWVDYNLMTTIPGCYAIGEANFSDHGANRLGASALMQGLADGYFVLPYTIGDYLADDIRTGAISTGFQRSLKKLKRA